jgi:hypothetical protein
VEKNLAGGRVEVTIETKDGMQYIVSRFSGDEPIVLTIDRQPTDISFKTGMVFGAYIYYIYSQTEVETIADCKASQLALLDKFQADSIAERKSSSEAPCGASVAPGIGDQLIGLFSHWRNQSWASMVVSGERFRIVFEESLAPATEPLGSEAKRPRTYKCRPTSKNVGLFAFTDTFPSVFLGFGLSESPGVAAALGKDPMIRRQSGRILAANSRQSRSLLGNGVMRKLRSRAERKTNNEK